MEIENIPSLFPSSGHSAVLAVLEMPGSTLPTPSPSSRHLVKLESCELAWLLGSNKVCVERRAVWPLGLA